MFRGWQMLKKHCVLILCGMSAITLTPSVNYSQFITTPEQMAQKNWQRTGKMLRMAIEKSFNNEQQRYTKC